MRKITPYITEKTVKLIEQNKFTLIVDYDANKKEVESLVKKFYKVNPLEIKILKTKYLSSTKHRKNYLDRGVKKAIITLEKGKNIPGFDYKKDEKESKSKKEVKKIEKKKDSDGKKS